MRAMVLTAFVSVVATLGVVMVVPAGAVPDPTFTLRPVANSADTANCAKDNGKAALIASIDSNGVPTEAWAAFCLLPAGN